ncbi:thermonuclease [Marinitoga sp. 1197]|uniref:thermonuclease family protein n=1 Tax=Marinitoga sp. 1197 TaxID=1428449 RepID=UPI000658F61F|nr:thermonuclease family protein [Marinitoga sp. 1197]KLO22835.1 thermonuclease [Marinitoga sp. 1197]
MLKKLYIFVGILISLLLITSCSKQTQINKSYIEKNYYVSKVIDGDTIKVYYDGDETSVRLIGIDTPETHSGDKPIGELGDTAYWFVRNKIYSENSKKSYVYMEFDSNSYGNYGRLLAYVYYKGKDGKMHFLNEEIIKNGLARPLFYSDTSKHKNEFIEAYKYAYENRKGIFQFFDDDNRKIYENDLSDSDIGKIRWVRFKVKSISRSGSFYHIYSENNKVYITIRCDEYKAFFKNLNIYDLDNKEIEVYGEVWKDNGIYEILARSEFEFKVIK